MRIYFKTMRTERAKITLGMVMRKKLAPAARNKRVSSKALWKMERKTKMARVSLAFNLEFFRKSMINPAP